MDLVFSADHVATHKQNPRLLRPLNRHSPPEVAVEWAVG